MHGTLNNTILIDTQILITLLKWMVGGAFTLGAFQVLVLWRILTIESKLGNGKPGIFVRKSEITLMKENADNEHKAILDRLEDCLKIIEKLQDRLDKLEDRDRRKR